MSSTIAGASTASSSSTSSPGCVPFAFRRGGTRGQRLPAPAPAGARTTTVPHGGAPAAACGCGRPLCRAAEVLGGGIQSAFFLSLDGCYCLELRTDSSRESESEDGAPLISRLPSQPPHDDGAAAARSGGARRRRASAGGKPRRGLSCCTPNSTSVN